jgi:hypothetical protein
VKLPESGSPSSEPDERGMRLRALLNAQINAEVGRFVASARSRANRFQKIQGFPRSGLSSRFIPVAEVSSTRTDPHDGSAVIITGNRAASAVM